MEIPVAPMEIINAGQIPIRTKDIPSINPKIIKIVATIICIASKNAKYETTKGIKITLNPQNHRPGFGIFSKHSITISPNFHIHVQVFS